MSLNPSAHIRVQRAAQEAADGQGLVQGGEARGHVGDGRVADPFLATAQGARSLNSRLYSCPLLFWKNEQFPRSNGAHCQTRCLL